MSERSLTRDEAVRAAAAGADAMLANMAAELKRMRTAARALDGRFDIGDAWDWIVDACRDD